ncbi:MAG: hypothetical protein ACT4NX_03735 [Deltaproteobacteria bacterium]
MRKALALMLVMAISFSSLAMASDFGAGDASFLFNSSDVAASAIGVDEMQSTHGQLLGLGGIISPLLGPILPLLAPVFGIVNSVPVVGGLVNTVLALVLS